MINDHESSQPMSGRGNNHYSIIFMELHGQKVYIDHTWAVVFNSDEG